MNRANRIKSKLYDGKPIFTTILSGNGYFGKWQTVRALGQGLLPSPGLGEGGHRSLARRLKAVRRERSR
jgi:hypothetical protein